MADDIYDACPFCRKEMRRSPCIRQTHVYYCVHCDFRVKINWQYREAASIWCPRIEDYWKNVPEYQEMMAKKLIEELVK